MTQPRKSDMLLAKFMPNYEKLVTANQNLSRDWPSGILKFVEKPEDMTVRLTRQGGCPPRAEVTG
jgi:hypothetical protein